MSAVSSDSKLNASSSSRIEDSLVNNDWFLTVESQQNPKMEDSTFDRPQIKIENCDVHFEPKKESDRNLREQSVDREIAVEFLDVSNEQKFDKLIKDEKIKTPFKRRLSGNSNESRSSSPLSMQSTDDVKFKFYSKNVPKKSRYDCRRDSGGSGEGHSSSRQEMETSEEILARRQKQIDYGKNTIGYDNYVQQVPRKERTKEHPWTPPKRTKYSRRAWDGLVKVWRKKLHCWDPAGTKEEDIDEANSDNDSATA